jgi:hypothetical protein
VDPGPLCELLHAETACITETELQATLPESSIASLRALIAVLVDLGALAEVALPTARSS